MTLRELTIDQESLSDLDAYTASLTPAEFLQSSQWVIFQQALGKTVKLFEWSAEKNKGYFLGIETKLPLGRLYLYIPRGPIVHSETVWARLIKELQALQQYIFIRFEPDHSFSSHDVRRVVDIQPSKTVWTRVQKNEKELLAAMHPKTRYNIKLGLKNNLLLSFDDTEFEDFFALMKETAQRDKFNAHSTKHYKKMLETKTAVLATVRDDSGLLAGGLFARFGKTMTYVHGASSSKNRNLMAPYALHWEMMMKAAAEGLEIYDWHGINEKKWPGVTRFKKGFGGEEFQYPGTFDIVIDKIAYAGYTIMRSIRRLF